MADVCPSLLRDTSLKVEEKLKIACVIARKGRPSLTERKVAFLTKWACQEICNVYSKKTRSPPAAAVCSQLWTYLATMLESEQLIRHQNREKEPQDPAKMESLSGAPISVHLIQAMSNVLRSQDAVECVDPVLNCMMLILKQPPPLPAVFYKFEIVVSLLASLLVLAGKECDGCLSSTSDSNGELRGNAHLVNTTLCLLLDQFNYLQSTQGNQKKVFIAICCQLLPSVIAIRYSLQDGSLLDKLDALLSSLFSKDHIAEYSSALSAQRLPTLTGGENSDISYTKLLFWGLKELLDDAPTCQKWTAVLNVIPVLFKAFLQQNSNMKKKLSRAIEFNFFLKLLWIFGFSLSNATSTNKQKKDVLRGRTTVKRVKVEEADEVEGCGERSSDENSKTEVMDSEDLEGQDSDDQMCEESTEEMEEHTFDWEAWLVGVQTGKDVVEDWEEEESKRFKEPVIKVLMTCLQLLRIHNVYQAIEDLSSGNRQFQCLSNLCMELVQNMNKHNISAVVGCLEAALQLNHKLTEPLLVHLLLLTTSHGESRLKMNSFVQRCITIYSKLHQLGVLVSMMFSVFEKIAMSPSISMNHSTALSKSSQDWFGKHIQKMPVGQSVALLEQLSNSFQSIFLTQLPRKRKKRKHNHRESGLESISDNFKAALLCGVDVFHLVLLSTPLTVWTSDGLHKEKAMKTLLGIQRDVILPLMIAAKDIIMLHTSALCMSYTLQGLLHCISTTMPAQPSVHHTDDTSCEQATMTAACENDLMSEKLRLVLCERSSVPVPIVWQSDSFTEQEQVFTASATYLLKAMSVQELRFARDCYTSEDIAHLLNFVFAKIDLARSDEHTALWSGQIISVNDENQPIAVGELVLSSLTLLYKDCLDLHLQNVALFLHSSLLGGSVNNRDHERDDGKSAREVAVAFLHSQGFQDMRRLHESLLALCFEQAAVLLPKRFKELKTAMQCCSGQLLDSSDHLEKVIEQGTQLLGNHDDHHMKKRKSVLKSTQHLSVCLEIMRAIPMCFSHPELLQRCILVLTIQHIILVYSLCTKEVLLEQEPFCQLQDLHVVLTWVLASLVNCDRVSMKKKTSRLRPLPFSQLLQWFYISSKHCATLAGDKTKELQTSFLLLMETSLENALKIGAFPTTFVQSIMEDVSAIVVGTEEASAPLAESLLHLMAIKICKIYSDLKPDHRVGSFLHQPMLDLLKEVSMCLSQLRKKSSEHVLAYTQLISGFSLLFRTNPPSDITHKSKSVKVLKLLVDQFCCNDALNIAVSNPSLLFSVIDVLSVAVTPTNEEERHDIVCMTVVDSWIKSVTLLKKYLEYDLKQPDSNTCNYLAELYSDRVKNKVCDCDVQLLLPQIDGLMMHLIAAANREQIILMFQLLHRENCDSVAVALTVCHCWSVILGAKLQSESQRELRKWHTKILLQCESLAIQHREAISVIVMSLSITTHLVALPAKVGLDSRLVILSLHQTAVLRDFHAPDIEPQRCVPMVAIQSVGQLLHTVLKNHSSIAASCPGPVITSINNLVKVFLKFCTLKDEERETSIANTISRVFDHLAGRQEFTKFIACILSSYIETVVKYLPPKAIKTTILPGVYSLLRHCSENDVAFIQSSLDTTSRTLFQSLLEDFRKQKRYV